MHVCLANSDHATGPIEEVVEVHTLLVTDSDARVFEIAGVVKTDK